MLFVFALQNRAEAIVGLLCTTSSVQPPDETTVGAFSAEARVMRLEETDDLFTASSLTESDFINTTLCSATNFMVDTNQETESVEGLSPGNELTLTFQCS